MRCYAGAHEFGLVHGVRFLFAWLGGIVYDPLIVFSVILRIGAGCSPGRRFPPFLFGHVGSVVKELSSPRKKRDEIRSYVFSVVYTIQPLCSHSLALSAF
jgi:hypothetical protein